jgi:sugar/nucleoside kinase (ribokinase family)
VASSVPTARSLILVTPDGERTMNTFLGVSPEFGNDDVDPDLIQSGRVVYLEGYLFDRPEAKAAFRKAADIASKAGRQVALTLSDPFCVDRHRSEFRDLIRSRIDVLFANENELLSLYQTKSFEDASRQVRNDTKLAVITRSAKGSLILQADKAVSVRAEPVVRVADTTGAGDLYAAGFLFGLTHGRDLEHCGLLGSLAAAEIISHIGARPQTPLAKLAAERGL